MDTNKERMIELVSVPYSNPPSIATNGAARLVVNYIICDIIRNLAPIKKMCRLCEKGRHLTIVNG